MRFKNIYDDLKNSTTEALLSLWTPGLHPMRKPLQDMFNREPLVAPPVFQSSFGWEPAEDCSWNGLFNDHVERELKIGQKYLPYKHQVNSWQQLTHNHSIVVTSGTGSGKTECFMYPILNDIYQARQNNINGIQAIFLYPLNALMADQKDRLGKLCDSLDIKFGVYNGNTPESNAPDGKYDSEYLTRREIRHNVPQILLSNPSMLEYILVRDKDQNMIRDSSGQLKWIVIDEAHSYSGSSAIELQYQIRRILDAFNVTMDNVNFACTSATIGDEEHDEILKDFISNLTGKPQDQIHVIGGKRIVPELSQEQVCTLLNEHGLSNTFDARHILELRKHINSVDGMNLREIWEDLGYKNVDFDTESCLDRLDTLCDLSIQINKENIPLLSLRGHFFLRMINGIYACPNHNCSAYNESPFGSLTSYPASTCKYCHTPLIELVQCKQCSEFMYLASQLERSLDGEFYSLNPLCTGNMPYDPFKIEYSDQNNDQTDDPSLNDFTLLGLNYKKINYNPIPFRNTHYTTFDFTQVNSLHINTNLSGEYVNCRTDRSNLCPNCNASMTYSKVLKFRIPTDFLNNVIAPKLLKETSSGNHIYGKYIAFTDSRQGTAISAKKFNIEVERKNSWYRLVKQLAAKHNRMVKDPFYCFAKEMLHDQDPSRRQAAEDFFRNQTDGLSLHEAAEAMYDGYVFRHISDSDDEASKSAYKSSLVRNYLARRTIYQNTAENMGVIHFVYPQLQTCSLSVEQHDQVLEETGVDFNNTEWQNFLKICIDFFLRERTCIQAFVELEKRYTRDANTGTPIFPYDSPLDNVIKWPTVSTLANGDVSERQNRLTVLLCAGLGIETKSSLTKHVNLIKTLLLEAWNQLIEKKLLTQVPNNHIGYNDPNYYKNGESEDNLQGYYLDITPSVDNTRCRIELLDRAFVCPVTHKLVDVLFFGYSPSMQSILSSEIIQKYKVIPHNEVMLPYPPSDENIDIWLQENENIKRLKELGIWSNRYTDIYSLSSAYIAAEHSAQQSNETLNNYVDQFKNNSGINILNCSTTMEMGVDIGDIELVLMTTIPPTSANYMQRAGRAGRKGQSRSAALSYCNATAIGLNAFNNPKWAIESANYMGKAAPSHTIIQRHINSFFFREFIIHMGNNLGRITRLKDFLDTPKCSAFIDFLDDVVNNHELHIRFRRVFGNEEAYSAVNTRQRINSINTSYHDLIQELRTAFEKEHPDPDQDMTSKARAIFTQIGRVEMDMLLQHLSEQQFIPNASMPTGIVEFDFSDKIVNQGKKDCLERIKNATNNYEATNDAVLKRTYSDEIAEYKRLYDKLKKNSVVTRDVRTALNEYAPGQTVVIDENNYVSAGICRKGDFDITAPQYFIYHCPNCGITKFSQVVLNGLCDCGGHFHSIIEHDKNHLAWTRAIEPIGYRTDCIADKTKYENTPKEYYDIIPELTDVSWTNPVECHLCQSVGKKDGEILFINMGKGNGFAVCPNCGRSVVDIPELNNLPGVLAAPGGHTALWGGHCQATATDIWRHVVFTGRLQTTYTVLKFFADEHHVAFLRDEATVYSLGVLIKRSLVKYLGIDENEIDFGIKYTDTAVLLFVFDTNKGGCGYSLKLNDQDTLHTVLEQAFNMVNQYTCHCEDIENGACSRCLVDRTSINQLNKLSKFKAMEWLRMQKGNYTPVPNEIQQYSPEAHSVYRSFKQIAKDAINDPNIHTIDFFIEKSNEIIISDWSDTRSGMGAILNKCRLEGGKKVRIYLEYDPMNQMSLADKLQYCYLNQMLASYDIIPVLPTKDFHTGLILRETDRVRRYFTDQNNTLNMCNSWGDDCNRIFVDYKGLELGDGLQASTLPSVTSILQEGAGRYHIYDGYVQNNSLLIDEYFTNCVLSTFLQSHGFNKELMQTMLRNDDVNIIINDSYLCSPLSVIILEKVIENFQSYCGFQIASIQVRTPLNRERNYNTEYLQRNWDKFGNRMWLHCNFRNADDCDNFIKKTFKNLMNIDVNFNDNGTDHSRSVKFIGNNGTSIEFRPDQGLGGGWKTNERYNSLENVENMRTVMNNIRIEKQYEGKQILLYLVLDNEQGNA